LRGAACPSSTLAGPMRAPRSGQPGIPPAVLVTWLRHHLFLGGADDDDWPGARAATSHAMRKPREKDKNEDSLRRWMIHGLVRDEEQPQKMRQNRRATHRPLGADQRYGADCPALRPLGARGWPAPARTSASTRPPAPGQFRHGDGARRNSPTKLWKRHPLFALDEPGRRNARPPSAPPIPAALTPSRPLDPSRPGPPASTRTTGPSGYASYGLGEARQGAYEFGLK